MALSVYLYPVTNIFGSLEFFHRKNISRRGPESRLYLACFAAVLLPIGMFIYAWCSFSRVPWIALAIGITLFMWAVFIIYLAVFTYLADW